MLGLAQPVGLQPAQLLAPRLAALDQAGAFEHADMLGGAGEAHRERRGEFADRAFARGEVASIARRVGSASAAKVRSSRSTIWLSYARRE